MDQVVPEPVVPEPPVPEQVVPEPPVPEQVVPEQVVPEPAVQYGFSPSMCDELKETVNKLMDCIAKIGDIETQMVGLASQGFSVQASIDSLQAQKAKFEQFIAGTAAQIKTLNESAQAISQEIKN